jgi:hypothetical protein
VERKSLMDGISTGPAPKAKAAGGDKKTLKLSIAVGLLIVAAGVISVYEGWIPTPFTREEVPPPPTAEQTQAVQQRQKQIEQRVKQGEVIVNSGS